MNCHTVFLFSVVLCVLSCEVSTLNILGIFPYQGKSHFIVFKVYLQELARRGHNITVISHFPEAKAPPNYHDISLAGSVKIVENDVPFQTSYITLLHVAWFLTGAGKENCEILLASHDVINLIKSKPKYDVIVVEQFNSDCALGLAYKLKAPVVGITSHILMPYHYNRFGIPNNPSFVPFHFLGGGTKPTLLQRVERTIFDIYFKALYYINTQRNNQLELAKYYDDIPPLEELARNIKFLLLYHNLILTGTRIFPVNVIEVGGYHLNVSQPLTGELKKFMDDAEYGVVYISFGSVVKSSTMPEDKLKAVLGAIAELPYRFIWKWESEAKLMDKNKLYLARWLPQADILGHSKTLAFLSHAGMGGTTEAIHFGVPMVAIPVIGDQPANAASIEESGLGVQLQISDLTTDNLVAAFKKVLDPKFRENVKILSKAFRDRPLPPLDTAVFWTEYAAKYPNFTFRSPAADVPFYQYYNIDVLSALTLVFLSILYIISLTFKLLCGKSNRIQNQRVKHKKEYGNKYGKKNKRE